MTISHVSDTPFEVRALARTIATLREHARMDVAFGGRALPGGTSLEITEMSGTRTRSLANLIVGNGAGIGAKALALGRPVSVANYLAAEGFTHAYDHAVRPEALETVAALPIFVARTPRLVVYLATRAQVGLGDKWFESLTPLIRKLERDIAVDDEVRRRLALVQSSTHPTQTQPLLSQADLRDIALELADLAGAIKDEALHARLEAVRRRFTKASVPRRALSAVALTPREIDVLAEVARGSSNREVGEALGLLPNTVKSYLKTAMRKLDANNRVQAIMAAREAGIIR